MKTRIALLCAAMAAPLCAQSLPEVTVQHVTREVCLSIHAFIRGPQTCQPNIMVMVRAPQASGVDITIHYRDALGEWSKSQHAKVVAGMAVVVFAGIGDVSLKRVIAEPHVTAGPSAVIEFE